MQYSMKLFVADRTLNEMMESFDMKGDYKWYVYPCEVVFSTKNIVDEKYFINIIEKSKKEKEMWIPAIEFCGKIYKDESVKELSDGKKSIFI